MDDKQSNPTIVANVDRTGEQPMVHIPGKPAVHSPLSPRSGVKCSGVSKRGQPCRRDAEPGGVYCPLHDPSPEGRLRASEYQRMLAARARDNAAKRRAARYELAAAQKVPLRTAKQCRDMIEGLIGKVLATESGPIAQAPAVATLMRAHIEILKTIESRERLDELEARVARAEKAGRDE